MTIEEQLKQFILSRYGSLREFTMSTDIPYSTLDSILRRQIKNSGVSNILKICNALHISADDLIYGKITPVTPSKNNIQAPTQMEIIIKEFKEYLLSNDFTLNGKTLDHETIEEFNAFIDLGMDLVKRHIK